MEKIIIREAIIVEGRDDTAAVNKAVECLTIETHGFGMADEMWKRIETAYEAQGIIVFTDPDYAGQKIREKILQRFPEAKQAFLPKDKALKKGNIGVENAKGEDIIQALENAHFTSCDAVKIFREEDMLACGLMGTPEARDRREKLGNLLGIGYSNGKSFLKKLNQFSIPRDVFFDKVKEIE